MSRSGIFCSLRFRPSTLLRAYLYFVAAHVTFPMIQGEAYSQSYTFTTIAGMRGCRTVACSGADGTNSEVRFNGPQGIAAHDAGAIYIADTANYAIRRIRAIGSDWVVDTIAGFTGASGSTDGTNSNARFAFPFCVTLDSAGNLFVADGQSVIRKIIPIGTNWVVTTIAGLAGAIGTTDGTNSSARFRNPRDIAVDSSGCLFVTDYDNHTVRKLTPVGTNWVVTTISGLAGTYGSADGTNSGARFSGPSSITLDNLGNLYVTDHNNCTIRKITPDGTNWVVTTLAGLAGAAGFVNGTNSEARFTYPYGISRDIVGNLYVADGSHTIRKLEQLETNWVVTTLTGFSGHSGSTDGDDSAARFWNPSDVVVRADGVIWVADYGNNTVRSLTLVETNWAVKTIAGLPGPAGSNDGLGDEARFNSPGGVATGLNGDLYLADTDNNTVRKIAFTGAKWVTTTIAGVAGTFGSADGTNENARFFSPSDIAVDEAGNLFVSDRFSHTIRKITAVGTNWMVSTIAGQAGASGNLDGTNTAARFNDPLGIVALNSSNLCVADAFNHTIRRLTLVDSNWIVITLAGKAGVSGSADGTNSEARFWAPSGIAADSTGNLYITDQNNNTVRRLSINGTNSVVKTLVGFPLFPGSWGSSDGTNGGARFRAPEGLTVDRDGNLFVADSGNGTIRKITPIGTDWVVTTVGGKALEYGWADGTGIQAKFNYPTKMAIDSLGNLYVTERVNHTLRKAVASSDASPSLQITLVGQQGVLNWPLSAANFVLETSLLPIGDAWSQVTNGVSISGESFVLTNLWGSSPTFFRLHRP